MSTWDFSSEYFGVECEGGDLVEARAPPLRRLWVCPPMRESEGAGMTEVTVREGTDRAEGEGLTCELRISGNPARWG